MKRREAVKLVPLAAAGMGLLPGFVSANGKQPLGIEYLRKVRKLLKKIKSTESEELLEASHCIARTVKQGKTGYFNWDIGHSNRYDIWPDRPGNTDIMQYGTPDKVAKGDLLLTNTWSENLGKLHEQGAFFICGPRPWLGDNLMNELLRPDVRAMTIRPYADLWIELYATSYGGIMDVPGETAPLGPVSGVVGMMTLWMMVADAARLLAMDNITFKVLGDEPELKRNDVNVDMNRPLGEVYYARAMEQLMAVEQQFQAIDRIAAMAVHSALTGGRVYVYSRHPDNLCAEGTVRRGGLGLTFGVYGPPEKLMLMDDPLQQGRADLSFKPTDKDTIIMGIGKPDDPEDLASLDVFKKAGAGITAIGPSTRNGSVPKGRTVPKEVNVSMGYMTDTYGLFALPGIKRKIAPTSGLVNNQIFWAVCCQIAEKIMERTGNAPGIYLSGALKGGMEKLNEVKRLYKERGY